MKNEIKIPKISVSFKAECFFEEAICTSNKAYNIFMQIWNLDTIELYEEFKVIYVNRANKVIGYRNISRGATSSTVVNIKLIASIALACNAEGIFLGHNHPSSNLKPSEQDKKLTSKICKALLLFDIKILDHLIISPKGYFSFCDEGILSV